jgi:hemoglobin
MTTIYERIGGAPSVETAVDLFYRKVWADPMLAGYFDGIDRARLKAHQRAFITAALGGVNRYEGRAMDKAHAGLGITDDAFDRVVTHLAATLTELGVDEVTIGEIAGALAPLRTQIVEAAPAPAPMPAAAAQVGGFRKLLRRVGLARSA